MKIAYFDCQSGISGDMILGALVDLGVDFKAIQKGLKTLPLKGYELKFRRVRRGAMGGTKIDVLVKPSAHTHSRNIGDIQKIVQGSKLPRKVITQSLEIFERIARAEARVHRIRIDKVHFHEVGAVDSIIDVVGGVLALELLAVDRVLASPINTGEGTVACDHGILPVPAPATLELLKGIPCYSSGVPKELATPTGVAMIGVWAENFQSLPLMTIRKTGYGSGTHIIKSQANLLRILLGEDAGRAGERVTLIETNIDDMNPEFYEHVMETLFSAGALDVFFTPILMKKNRPAVKLSTLVPPHRRAEAERILLTHTSTYGVRSCEMDRLVLEREKHQVKTPYGKVAVKVGKLDGNRIHFSPEYEDCRKIAKMKGLPIKVVYDTIARCAEQELGGE